MAARNKSSTRAWADDDEEEELPSRQETGVNSKGIKTVTEYRLNAAGQKVKTVREIKVVKLEKRVPKAIAARKARMKKFGAALTSYDESNVTIVSTTEEKVTLEDPDSATGEGSQSANVKDAINEFARKQMWRKLQQKYGVDGDTGGMSPVPEDGEESFVRRPQTADENRSPAGQADDSARSAYKIPHIRGKSEAGGSGLSRLQNASSSHDDRDHATLRVTNISEETAEADLQILFSPYGRVARIYLAKDRETMASRGFAFVSYVHRADAARAMQALQGHGYDHLILKIEWAQPSTRSANEEGGLSNMRTSGYGQKLAQDTTQRVAYASNLTANR